MGSGAGPPSPASGRFPVDPVESSSPSAETSDGQPVSEKFFQIFKFIDIDLNPALSILLMNSLQIFLNFYLKFLRKKKHF